MERKPKHKEKNETQEKKAVLREFMDYKRFSLARNFGLADIVTIMNGMCGVLSILYSMELLVSTGGLLDIFAMSSNSLIKMRLAFLFPFLGLIFDILDGRVARWSKRSSMLGQELDSLADLISFGVAPGVLGFLVGLRYFGDKIVLACFVCAGLARLARYNVTAHLIPATKSGKIKYFEGLPIPTTLFIVAYMWYSVENGIFRNGTTWGSFMFLGIEFSYFAFIFGFWSVCMTSKNLKVPKL